MNMNIRDLFFQDNYSKTIYTYKENKFYEFTMYGKIGTYVLNLDDLTNTELQDAYIHLTDKDPFVFETTSPYTFNAYEEEFINLKKNYRIYNINKLIF